MRTLLADDDILFRTGLAHVLAEAGFQVVGQAGDPRELLELVEATQPELAVIDIRMPPTHTTEGVQAALEIRRKHPGVGVLLLSQYVHLEEVGRLLNGTARGIGYLLKGGVVDLDEFCSQLRTVGSGGSAIDPAVFGDLIRRSGRSEPLQALSDREREVLCLVARGYSNRAIADDLHISQNTVEAHVRRIFDKLNLESYEEQRVNRRILAVLTFLGLEIGVPTEGVPEGGEQR